MCMIHSYGNHRARRLAHGATPRGIPRDVVRAARLLLAKIRCFHFFKPDLPDGTPVDGDGNALVDCLGHPPDKPPGWCWRFFRRMRVNAEWCVVFIWDYGAHRVTLVRDGGDEHWFKNHHPPSAPH